jgi:hypothetical protein
MLVKNSYKALFGMLSLIREGHFYALLMGHDWAVLGQ